VKLNKRSDQITENHAGGHKRVMTDEIVSIARTLNRDEVMKVWLLGSCENFVGK